MAALCYFYEQMKKIILQGICYDAKSSYLRGAAKAPPLIRLAYHSDASNYFAENGMEISPDSLHDAGDYEVTDYFDIEQTTLNNLKGKNPMLSLGGDHSITYPILKAFHRVYGPLNILHIDAHADLYDRFENDPYSHACPFARIMEEKLASRLIQTGIRTLTSHQRDQANKFNVEVIEMKDFNEKTRYNFDGPLYLSVDIDALDPAFAPGVSHQEPGGFSTRELLSIIQGIKVPILGADIVEYNPSQDLGNQTAMVCAKLMREIMAQMKQTYPRDSL